MSEEEAFSELAEIISEDDLPGLRDWLIRHADNIKYSTEFRRRYQAIALGPLVHSKEGA